MGKLSDILDKSTPKKYTPSAYQQKLLDPRWQRKRLEIMERAEFRCEVCRDDKRTLHVHHGYYEKGFDPWDYENSTLWCLCDCCHEDVQYRLLRIYKEIATVGPVFDVEALFLMQALRVAVENKEECDKNGVSIIEYLSALIDTQRKKVR